MLLAAGCLGTPVGGPIDDGPPSAAWTEGQSINETALLHTHFDAIQAAGSVTVNRTARLTIAGERPPPEQRPDWYRPTQITVQEINLEDTRYHRESITVGQGRASSFINAEIDADRRRDCPTCAWEYRFVTRPPHDTLAQEIDRYRRDRTADEMAELFDDWNFTYVETVHRDGETLYHYRGNWTFDKPIPPFWAPPNGSGRLLVTDDGVIRLWEYTFTGQARVGGESDSVPVTLAYSMRYYEVGTTTVERPDWVDTARQANPAPTTVASG